MKKITLVLFLICNSLFSQCIEIFDIYINPNEVCYPLILNAEHLLGGLKNPQFYSNSQDNNGVLLPLGTSINNIGMCTLPDGSIEFLEDDIEFGDYKIYAFDIDEERNCSYETSKVIKLKEPFYFPSRTGITVCPSNPKLNIDLKENAPADFGNGTFKWKTDKDYNGVTGESTSIRWGTIINDFLVYNGESTHLIVYNVTPISDIGCIGKDFKVSVFLAEHPIAYPNNFNRNQCSSTPLNLQLDNFVHRFNNTFIWSTKDNPNVTGESLTEQTTNRITDNLVNESNINQEVVYTITPSNAWCTAPSFTITVTVEKCSELPLESVNISPNPTPNFINIKNIDSDFKVMLYSQFGELIYEGNNMSKVNIESYPKGVYILKIKTEKDNLSVKILKH